MTVVAVHGGPGMVTKAMAEVSGLATYGFDVARFYQRGIAPSTTPTSRAYTLEAYADDITQVTRHVASETPRVLIAFSWGALPAVLAAAMHPGDFDGLVLVSAAPPTWKAGVELGPLVEETLDRWTMLGKLPPDWRDLPPCDQFAYTIGALDGEQPGSALPVIELEACDFEVMKATRNASASYDLRSAFASLNIPILIIHGGNDRLASVATFEDAQTGRERVRIIKGCGHVMLADARCRLALYGEFRRWATDAVVRR